MEKDTLHRAADTINNFVVENAKEGPSNVNLHEAIAVRDDLRELARSKENEYEMPEVGDTMYDNGCPVDIVEVTHYTAELYHIENGDGKSVAEYRTNANYDPNSPVVKVTYPGGGKKYAMPLARLSWTK